MQQVMRALFLITTRPPPKLKVARAAPIRCAADPRRLLMPAGSLFFKP
jgi:hypothetical protein